MTVSVYVPAALSLLLAAISRIVVARTAPTRAAVFVVAAMLCAAAATWGLVLLSATLLGYTSLVADEALERGVQLQDPVPELIGVTAVVLLVFGAIRVAKVLRARRATTRELRAVCSSCGTGELAVVALDDPHAFAVPGRPGRILVTRGLLSVLDGDERRVVLAHERAHLRSRHHWLRAATEVCAAVNPVLIPVREAVAFLVERSADEHAAAVTGSRELVARALTKAALASRAAGRVSRWPTALPFARCGVSARVAALHSDPPRPESLVPSSVLALGVATAIAAVQATIAFYQLIYWLWPN
ncbi:MAG: M56 family metallopeptidase [Pseudonocardiales bacterium]|nr:M56 family metallopeptidase [Pseudonocardiales bacterium]MBV9028881.1 M56 family metallopeptidase [Pseudonocardiales bacterium]